MPEKVFLLLFCCGITLTAFTCKDIRTPPQTIGLVGTSIQKPQLLDRHQRPITITYKNRWNLHDNTGLYQIPEFLQRAFILSEDKRFYQHNGVDWLARFHALWQNLAAFEKVRGASTITEQTIKMLHKRPRNLWSRWLEGFEAQELERRFSKRQILEFYLNQVPYSAQRRGVVQAARYYFDRDLDTLNKTEMMLLAILVRAPSRLDPFKHPYAAKPALKRMACKMQLDLPDHALTKFGDRVHSKTRPASFTCTSDPSSTRHHTLAASHFAGYVYKNVDMSQKKILTTLDRGVQKKTQKILEQRLADLKKHNVHNGAVLIVDHNTNHVLGWVVAGDGNPDYKGSAIDAVTTPRQPGSTLKPLLYALALENNVFTAASLIDDSPLNESVGVGIHTYQNYSRGFYGPISLREALGNSLNIPAVRALQKVGVENFLQTLHKLGISSLTQHPDFYGDGLALGNGEVTLFELVQAYTTLARQGYFSPLHSQHTQSMHRQKRIFSAETSSLIANILSDPHARKREFGFGGLLQFPVQTAVKTGTSNDYRDAWAIGFNHRYTVGVWMGNLNGENMDEISGSRGPALILRAIFSELNKHKKTKPLYLDPRLVAGSICKETGLPVSIENKNCLTINEWFIPGTIPSKQRRYTGQQKIRIRHPGPNLQMAMDPRIPDHMESFQFSLSQTKPSVNQMLHVRWYLNDKLLGQSKSGNYQWSLSRGQHQLRAEIFNDGKLVDTDNVSFLVK